MPAVGKINQFYNYKSLAFFSKSKNRAKKPFATNEIVFDLVEIEFPKE